MVSNLNQEQPLFQPTKNTNRPLPTPPTTQQKIDAKVDQVALHHPPKAPSESEPSLAGHRSTDLTCAMQELFVEVDANEFFAPRDVYNPENDKPEEYTKVNSEESMPTKAASSRPKLGDLLKQNLAFYNSARPEKNPSPSNENSLNAIEQKNLDELEALGKKAENVLDEDQSADGPAVSALSSGAIPKTTPSQVEKDAKFAQERALKDEIFQKQNQALRRGLTEKQNDKYEKLKATPVVGRMLAGCYKTIVSTAKKERKIGSFALDQENIRNQLKENPKSISSELFSKINTLPPNERLNIYKAINASLLPKEQRDEIANAIKELEQSAKIECRGSVKQDSTSTSLSGIRQDHPVLQALNGPDAKPHVAYKFLTKAQGQALATSRVPIMSSMMTALGATTLNDGEGKPVQMGISRGVGQNQHSWTVTHSADAMTFTGLDKAKSGDKTNLTLAKLPDGSSYSLTQEELLTIADSAEFGSIDPAHTQAVMTIATSGVRDDNIEAGLSLISWIKAPPCMYDHNHELAQSDNRISNAGAGIAGIVGEDFGDPAIRKANLSTTGTLQEALKERIGLRVEAIVKKAVDHAHNVIVFPGVGLYSFTASLKEQQAPVQMALAHEYARNLIDNLTGKEITLVLTDPLLKKAAEELIKQKQAEDPHIVLPQIVLSAHEDGVDAFKYLMENPNLRPLLVNAADQNGVMGYHATIAAMEHNRGKPAQVQNRVLDEAVGEEFPVAALVMMHQQRKIAENQSSKPTEA